MRGHKALGLESGSDRIEALEDRSLGQTCALATPDYHRVQAAPIGIVVSPPANGRKWVATYKGETICVASSPLIASARILIAQGVDPNSTIEMWRADSGAWSLRGRLGNVAATLVDGETAKHSAKNGPPIETLPQAATRA